MKFSVCRLGVGILVFWGMASFPSGILLAEPETTGVVFKTIFGNAEFSARSQSWQPLRLDSKLVDGSLLRTSEGSTVDFYLNESKTTLRLTPGSKLAIETLKVWRAGDLDVTETQLKLIEGGIVGSQRKLMEPSQFQIVTPQGVARITGTEYLVRANGDVTVLKGSVSFTYNRPGVIETSQVSVAAGHSFNPSTGMNVAISAGYLKSIHTDINAVENNAEVYKAVPPTPAVMADAFVSPTKAVAGTGNGSDPQPAGQPR